MSTEDGIIYMISRSLKIFVSKVFFLHASNRIRIHGFIPYSSDEAINMSEDKVAAYSETWLDVINMVVCVDLKSGV